MPCSAQPEPMGLQTTAVTAVLLTSHGVSGVELLPCQAYTRPQLVHGGKNRGAEPPPHTVNTVQTV